MKRMIKNKCGELKSFVQKNYYNIKNLNDKNYKNDLYFFSQKDKKKIYLLGNKLTNDKKIVKRKDSQFIENNREINKINDKYNIKIINKKIDKIFKKLNLFTYEYNISKEIKSDIGWGCTFRCGQMFLFYFLKINTNKSQKQILNFFNNDNSNYFSLYNLVNHAKTFFKYKIGNFSSIYSFFIYLSHIHNTYNLNYFDEMILSKNDVIFLNEINTECNKKLIIFNIQINLNNKDILEDLKKIVSNKYFYGILGGIKKSCYYIIGIIDNYFYYLDPHSINDNKQLSKLFIKKEKIDKFNSNLGIIFYTKDMKEFHNLTEYLNKVNIINFSNLNDSEEFCETIHSSFDNEFLSI